MAETSSKNSKAAVASGELISDVTLESLRDFVQAAGYRVETIKDDKISFLRSATNGLAFDIRLGNSFAGAPDKHADIAFVALFAVRGTLPLELLNNWNRSRRFGRLFLDQPVPDQSFLVMCMDVSVAGGVSAGQLRGQIEIWDGLIQQLVPWLREELGKLAPSVDTAQTEKAPSKASEPVLETA